MYNIRKIEEKAKTCGKGPVPFSCFYKFILAQRAQSVPQAARAAYTIISIRSPTAGRLDSKERKE